MIQNCLPVTQGLKTMLLFFKLTKTGFKVQLCVPPECIRRLLVAAVCMGSMKLLDILSPPIKIGGRTRIQKPRAN